MISVKIDGRLGNQLFQYAFIYSAAKELNTSFYLDKASENFLLHKYFNLPKDFTYPLDQSIFKIKGLKNIFCVHAKNKFYSSLKFILRLQTLNFNSDTEPERNMKKLENNKLFVGFFQSELYFKSNNSELRKLFNLKSKYILTFKKLLIQQQLTFTFTVVHIRRGDYTDLGWNLPLNYYHRAITEIGSQSEFFVFISDEPEFINTEFAYLKNIYISKNEEIIDFQFLNNADKIVLSNSTFSWWGAYLNDNASKVIAPKYWLGQDKEFPNSILDKNWILL